jgi:hypothetical protein
MMKKLLCSLAVLPLMAGAASAATSKPGFVDRLEIVNRYDAYGGVSFGDVGAYEVIVAIAHGKLDPTHPANAGVVDIGLAPKDSDGLVGYSEDVVILRPKSVQNAKRVLFYDVVNRGNKLANGTFNRAGSTFAAGQEGNGLLLRLGYTLVWSGWQGNVAQTGQGDIAPVGTKFPTARNADGTPVTGTSRDEIIIDYAGITVTNGVATVPLSYPAASKDKSQVIFNWRQTWRTSTNPFTQGMRFDAPSTRVRNSEWSYVDNSTIQFNVPAGSDAGTIFEFIYPAKNPTVMGIGFAGLRDLITFLNHEPTDRRGNTNPLNDFKTAPCDSKHCDLGQNFDTRIIEGISQSGRFTRDFLWRGFNDDGRGNGGKRHTVFNGAFPIIAGSRKTYTDFRFAQPGRWSKQHEDHWQPGDQFPFGYGVITDPVSGRIDGILKKCLASDTCPRVVHLDGAFEVSGARGSLLVTNGLGSPVDVPDNVRLYEVPGTNHGGGAGVASLSTPDQCVYLRSAVVEATVDRALAPVIVEWVANDVRPPDSRYPTVQDGTLAPPTDQEAVGFPDLSNAGFPYYGYLFNPLVVTDYSNAAPVPHLGKAYHVLIGKTDKDGNEVAGVRVPEIVVPLATYAPWNVRKEGHAAGDGCISNASTFPLPKTHGAAILTGDPRPPLQERYHNKADYVAKVKAAAQRLVDQRLLLKEDIQLYVDQAKAQTLFP